MALNVNDLMSEADRNQKKEKVVVLDGQEVIVTLRDEFEGDSCTTISEETKAIWRRQDRDPVNIENNIRIGRPVSRVALDFYLQNFYEARKKEAKIKAMEAAQSDPDKEVREFAEKHGVELKAATYPDYSLDELREFDKEMLLELCRFYGVDENLPIDRMRQAILDKQEGNKDDVQRNTRKRAGVSGDRE